MSVACGLTDSPESEVRYGSVTSFQQASDLTDVEGQVKAVIPKHHLFHMHTHIAKWCIEENCAQIQMLTYKHESLLKLCVICTYSIQHIQTKTGSPCISQQWPHCPRNPWLHPIYKAKASAPTQENLCIFFTSQCLCAVKTADINLYSLSWMCVADP